MRLAAALSVVATLAGCAALGGDKAYRIPSSSMEPTLHCGEPKPGCEGDEDDRVIAESVEPEELRRGDIVVFEAPQKTAVYCGTGGTFVARLTGLPGERIELRIEGGSSFLYVDGRKLREPYIEADRRDDHYDATYDLDQGEYFVMGDNRAQSCDSREWGPLPAENIRYRVTAVERESGRIDFR